MIKQRKIPTLLGLLILLGGIAGGVLLVQKGLILFLQAEPTATPKQIKTTNISDNGFAVSWITEGEVVGFIKYGPTPSLDLMAVDDRDQVSRETASFITHHVTIKGLKPTTKYYFKIGSGKRLYDNNGSPYEVTTAPTTANPLPSSDPAYGMVTKSDDSPAGGVIIYLSLANTTPLSALAQSTGNWLITLNNARTLDLDTYVSYDREASIEEIFVQGGAMGTATAVVTTKNDSPVPTITLGKSYDFRETQARVLPTPTPSTSKFSLQPMGTPTVVEEELVITNPEESEEIASQKPEIQGTGPKGATIKITIESPETFTTEVVINEDGSWNWTPPSGLSPGEHTITVTLTDGTTVSRRFTILAAGAEFPAFTATPSGEASPSPTPTLVPRTAIPSTEAAIPEPGYLTPTFLLVIMGIGLILLGSVNNILTQKNG